MNPTHRALVVIDAQNEYFTGRLPIVFPDREGSLARIGEAMDAAHAAGIPVVVVRQWAPTESPVFAEGSDGFALHPAIAARPRDLLIDKRLPSALAGTGLLDWLAARDIGTLAVAGYMTQNCVDATVRHAAHLGYAVELLADACGAPDYANAAGAASAEELHRAFCVAMQARFAAVAPTQAWIAAITGGPALARGSVPASVAAAA